MESHPTVLSARLLTIQEVDYIPTRLLRCEKWWWLNGRGFKYTYAAGVFPDGSLDLTGNYVVHMTDSVRPVLIVRPSNVFVKGSIFTFGGARFEMINRKVAFCIDTIGESPYRVKDINTSDQRMLTDYELSDVKRYVDAWLEAAQKEE